MISTRRIVSGEVELYKRVRLAALLDAPAAFSTTHEQAMRRSPQEWHEMAEAAAAGAERAVFFAFDGDVPVGMAGLYRDAQDPTRGELIQVWVAGEYRGRGVAAELLATVLDWARENGFLAVRAGVTRGNARALAFYRKSGFSLLAEAPEAGQAENMLEIVTGVSAG